MNPQQKQLFRRLNAYNYDDYDGIIDFLKTGEYPDEVNTTQKRARFAEKFGQHFYVVSNEIRYDDGVFDLTVVRNNENIRNARLNALFTDKQVGMGHGIQQFYEIVIHRYLNITRKHVEHFLKSQTNYQLTRKSIKPKNPTKKYNRPNQAWVCDLIDMSNYGTRNQNYKYILSVLDLFSKKCWLRALRLKTAVDVRDAFQTFTTPQNKTKILFSDNGTEFQGELRAFLQANQIKHNTTESHTPEPNIENLNGQIRKFIAELAVRKKNLLWINELSQIEANLNSYNTLTRVTQKRDAEAEARLNDRDDNRLPARLNEQNVVRISQRAIESEIRAKNKAGLQKEVYVKYSVDTYVITRIYGPAHRNGFYKYALRENNQGGAQLLNTDNSVARFREADLLLIPDGVTRGENMTMNQSIALNKL